jgi:hypothetical protein
MAEKICLATGKACLAACEGDYCWVNRIVPVIAEETTAFITEEVNQHSSHSSIPAENRSKLAEIMSKLVKAKIKK